MDLFGLPLIMYIAQGGSFKGFFEELLAGDDDVASYASTLSAVTANLTTEQATVLTDTGTETDTLANIRSLIGTAFDDILTGNEHSNTLTGGTGDDTLYGLAGDDTLDGGEGDDVLSGGEDLDIASYKSAPAAVTIDLNDVGQRDTLGAGWDTLDSIEGVEGSD